MGSKEIWIEEREIEAAEMVERVRKLSGRSDPGFTKYNTLVLVQDGEAFVPASVSRKVKEGEQVVLIPISHGG